MNRRWAWTGWQAFRFDSFQVVAYIFISSHSTNWKKYVVHNMLTRFRKRREANENAYYLETRDMNVDECIRGRLLWETRTNVANHAGPPYERMFYSDRRGKGKGESLTEIMQSRFNNVPDLWTKWFEGFGEEKGGCRVAWAGFLDARRALAFGGGWFLGALIYYGLHYNNEWRVFPSLD